MGKMKDIFSFMGSDKDQTRQRRIRRCIIPATHRHTGRAPRPEGIPPGDKGFDSYALSLQLPGVPTYPT